MCDEYGLNAANFHFEIKLITKNATQAPLSFFVCFHKKDRGAYIYNRADNRKFKIRKLLPNYKSYSQTISVLKLFFYEGQTFIY